MLLNARLPHGFWVETMKIVVHLINKSLSKSMDGKVSKEAWSKDCSTFDQ